MYHIEKDIKSNRCTSFIFFIEKRVFEIPETYTYDSTTYATDAHKGRFPIKKSYTCIDPKRMPVPFYVHYLYIDGEELYSPPKAGLIPLDCQYEYSSITDHEGSFEITPVFLKIDFYLPSNHHFNSSLLKIINKDTIYYDGTKCIIDSIAPLIMDLRKELFCFYNGKLCEYIPLKQFVNKNLITTNILHFPGEASHIKEYWLTLIEEKSSFANVDNLTIITFATDENNSPLINQLKRNNINYINAVDDKSDWVNTKKIGYLLNALEKVETEYVLILDGYDVVIQDLNNILDKFKTLNHRIIFNATHNNYPNIEIDKIPNRESLGDFCYLNAGGCIGYKEDIQKFYQKVLAVQNNVENPNNSEQLLVRTVFAEYSDKKDNNFVFIDYSSTIFQVWNSCFYVGKIGDKYMLVNIEKKA